MDVQLTPMPVPAKPARLIAHLDMDAFYASVELLRYPDLRGRPVVIGGGRRHQPVVRADGSREYLTLRHYVGRGVVTTSTYEARAFGVHSAMGMMKAAALAPQAVLLPVDFDQYRRFSRLFKVAAAAVSPHIEDRGIDEIYIDLTDVPGAQADGGRAAGLRLKQAVSEATGLTCSVGITPNKLLSKLCSELDKPDGLTLLTVAEIPDRIWPLAARKLNGIGPKANDKLAALGLHTIGDIAAADPAWLVEKFGKSYGAWLHLACQGRDERPLTTHRDPKSISRETTFERDLHAVRDRDQLGSIFTDLCIKLAADLARKGCASRTIGIKLRFDDFRIVTRDMTLPSHTMDARAIRAAAGSCLKRVDLGRRLRLLGVRAGTLETLDRLVAAPRPPPPETAGEAFAPGRRPAASAAHSRTLPLFPVDDGPGPGPGPRSVSGPGPGPGPGHDQAPGRNQAPDSGEVPEPDPGQALSAFRPNPEMPKPASGSTPEGGCRRLDTCSSG